MPIFKDNKEITAVYYGKKVISTIYKGTKLVWEAISSCFGAGRWSGDKPWSGSDAWKGN